MNAPEFVIRGRRVALPDEVVAAAIHVREGRIVAVGSFADAPRGLPLVEVGDDEVVLPGLVDTHVHINEPGRTEWEGFRTATRAAAAGGATTLVEMPLNSIPATTTRASLDVKRAAAEGKCHVDVGFWGGVVPGNTPELRRMFEGGVFGFKCFLVPSGVDEFEHVTEADLRVAMPELASMGALLIVHAETPAPIEAALAGLAHADVARENSEHGNVARGEILGDAGASDPRRYETFLRSRPKAAEDEAVALMVRLCRETGARVHIVHHSSSASLPLLRAAKAEKLKFTAETCPHYLAFAAEDVPDGATEFKCCPPVRERENCERLWDALDAGVLDMIVSDHSPCPPELKRREEGDFLAAWGGIASLQLRLPVVWTEARGRGHEIGRVVEWLAAAPARLVGLEERKGSIKVGCDADLVVFRPRQSFKVEPEMLHHRHKLTPYAGRTLSGVVEATYLRGVKIYERGNFLNEAATGLLLAPQVEARR
ncbi:MAG TPA: amidohydrolase family protein [Pyrinomonadaceae bacterium]|jgi:allantoinase|nr:amidohydrolase family protein [Pyrinomonadaceae bacterium]